MKELLTVIKLMDEEMGVSCQPEECAPDKTCFPCAPSEHCAPNYISGCWPTPSRWPCSIACPPRNDERLWF
ncbi:MAG: hypothetical protein LBB09_01320 [Rickettsiales bacterium]|nr:hypothetical protein [Rickettsiales bacterium]